MDQQAKDVIQLNIEARAKKDFEDLRKELLRVCTSNLPTEAHGSYDSTKYLKHPFSTVFKDFISALEKEAVPHFKAKREEDFTKILTNLGSYLEMINH